MKTSGRRTWSTRRKRIRGGSNCRAPSALLGTLAAPFSVRFALSTANLTLSAQPAGTLYGAASSKPVAPATAEIARNSAAHPSPMVGKHLGGVIMFGAGLAVYSGSDIDGGHGVGGGTSAPITISPGLRHALKLDHVPNASRPITTTVHLRYACG